MNLTLKETYALHRELWQRMIDKIKANGISTEKYYSLIDLKLECLWDMGYEKDENTSVKGYCFLCQYYDTNDNYDCSNCPLRHNECGLYFKCLSAYKANDYENTLYYMEIIKGIAPSSYSEMKELGIA